MIAPAVVSATRRVALETVREIVLRALAGTGARVWLFGSSATGDARPRSDIDVAMEADGPVPAATLAALQDELEESDVPYVVELVDLAAADDALRRAVRDHGVRWT